MILRNQMSKIKHIEKSDCRCKECKHKIVIKTFFDNGCEILSPISLSASMIYRCSCGNVSKTKWFNFKKGERCRKCGVKKCKESNCKRLKVEKNIHQRFKENGCVLLEDNYVNQITPMRFICECGNEDIINWKMFQRGCRCKKCAKEKIKNRFVPHGEFHNRWNPNREEIKLRKTIRNRANKMLRRSLQGLTKNKTTFNMLGYTKYELINHLKNHENWSKVKDSKWEIDHYFPFTAFFDYNIFDPKIINKLENLRPISDLENKTKNDIYNKLEFESWLKLNNLFV